MQRRPSSGCLPTVATLHKLRLRDRRMHRSGENQAISGSFS
jgi:hypothetical protein